MAEFFLGLRLPAALEEQVEAWRRQFSAPRTVAHITVIPPFTWEGGTKELITLLKQALGSVKPFELHGEGLGSFDTRVLFVNVSLSTQLTELQNKLAQALRQRGILIDERPYAPHITLATWLERNRFWEYKSQLEGFAPNYTLVCQDISLFEFTKPGGWQPVAKIPLGILVESGLI